ncbi:MAG: response regulator [Acidobacteriota bacterium]
MKPLVYPSRPSDIHRYLDLLPVQAAVLDPACRIVHANPAWKAYAERFQGPLRYDTSWVYLDVRDPGFTDGSAEAQAAVAGIRSVIRGNKDRFEIDYPCDRDGERFWFRLIVTPAEESAPRGAIVLRLDLTEDREEEESLRLHEFASEKASGFVFWLQADGRFHLVNDRLCRALGHTRRDLLERHIWDVDPNHSESLWPSHVDELRDLGTLIYETQYKTKEGFVFTVEAESSIFRLDGREFVFVTGVEPPIAAEPATGSVRFQRKVAERTSELSATNQRLEQEVASRRETEEALREIQERLELALSGTNLGLWDWDLRSGKFTFDERWASLVGYEVSEIEPRLEGWTGLVHPDDEIVLRKALEDHLDGITDVYEIPHRLNHRSGDYRWVVARGRVAERDESGAAMRVVGTLQDITAHRDLEDRLLQSHKMEAIGRLAGGIAHDFNNLLTAINGYADLVLRKLEEESPHRKKIVQIRSAGERAAALTNRLLAFSRKQMLQPEVLNLNSVVRNMESLLLPIIGEQIGLRTRLDAALAPVKADLGQMEQVILNLAVNAKDAMPNGGNLKIETGNADPRAVKRAAGRTTTRGDYVCLKISDSGLGMDEETQAQAFDPFFTTKEQGQGTGLGLSMVYGIVRQSGGFIDLESRLGEGSTFHLFLPCAEEQNFLDAPRTKSKLRVDREVEGTERVFIVEDEPAVRDLVQSSLEAKGYRVHVAPDAETAVRALEASSSPVDLLVTDVLLPGMSGPELAQKVQKNQPDLEVVFMSGYTQDALGRANILDGNVRFLQKPFAIDVLLDAVRGALDD